MKKYASEIIITGNPPQIPHPRSVCGQIGDKFYGEDNELLSDIDKKDQLLVLEWIKEKLKPRAIYNYRHTSYGLKHILENDIGIYLTNNQFKDAMLICGYYPKDEHELNWVYRISQRSKAFKTEG